MNIKSYKNFDEALCVITQIFNNLCFVVDVDECSRPNDCAQLCNNTQGSYECYCRIGFKVNPNNIKNCIGML